MQIFPSTFKGTNGIDTGHECAFTKSIQNGLAVVVNSLFGVVTDIVDFNESFYHLDFKKIYISRIVTY